MKLFIALLLLAALGACQQAADDPGPQPYTYSIDYPASAQETALIQAAYAAWAAATEARFTQVQEHGLVSIVAEEPTCGSGDALACALVSSVKGHLVFTTIQLSPHGLLLQGQSSMAGSPIGGPAFDPSQFQEVVEHEIGHSLDLHHTSLCPDTMSGVSTSCIPADLSSDSVLIASANITTGWIIR